MGQYFGPPTAAYSNVPINAQYYEPSRFVISNIVQGSTQATTLVTTSVNHNYVIGQLVRLLIQPTYGCQQLNGQSAYVIAIPAANQITLALSFLNVNPFISSPSYGPTLPQVVAIGDENSGLISTTGRVVPTTAIPGSFVNISPQ